MIIDYLENCSLYENTDPRLTSVFEFLKKHAEKPFPDGKNIIDGDDVYANVFSYDTGKPEFSKYENHRQFIDVHYITEGEEVIYWAYKKCNTGESYDSEADVSFHEDIKGTPIPMRRGMIAIFFPDDVHMPKCILENESVNVKKVVAKIKR